LADLEGSAYTDPRTPVRRPGFDVDQKPGPFNGFMRELIGLQGLPWRPRLGPICTRIAEKYEREAKLMEHFRL
jgi:hypothetical protein